MNSVPLFNVAWMSWWTIIAVRSILTCNYCFGPLMLIANRWASLLAKQKKDCLLTGCQQSSCMNIFSCHPKSFENTRLRSVLFVEQVFILLFIKGCWDPQAQTCIVYPANCWYFICFFKKTASITFFLFLRYAVIQNKNSEKRQINIDEFYDFEMKF